MAAGGNRSEAPGTIRAVPAEVEDPTWERLEDQLGWYSRKSGESQRLYKWLKLLEIAVAATLPVVAAVHSPVWVTGGLAAVIVVLEGAQQVYQFQEHWITYRSTAEALKRESARLRKRFQDLKEELRVRAQRAGLLDRDG